MKHIRLIQEILEINAIKFPNKTALICENDRLTYFMLNEMSDRMANAFTMNGIRDGDRILFYTLNSMEMVVGLFAALKANAVFVGVDSGNTYETLKYIASDCTISAVMTYDHRKDVVSRLFGDVPSLKFGILTGKKVDNLPDRIFSFNAMQEAYIPKVPSPRRIENDLAFMIYTSGSTGISKGVMVTHRSILFAMRSGIEFFGLTENEVHTSPLQVSFSPGINQMFQTLMVGGTLILEKSLTFPVMMLKRMETEGATGFAAVPTVLALLMQMDLSRFDLSKLRFVSSVGAALPTSLIDTINQKLPGVSIYSYYGMAEASYSLVMDPSQIHIRPTSVGKPFPGTKAWIIDENGESVGPGQIGELVLRGSHIRSGYWNHPEETKKRFRPGSIPGDRICYTGDMFNMDEEGFFYFIGRSDEILKSGAKKVVPREIENALYSLSGVYEAAVIGVPDPILGCAIKAFVVPSKDAINTLTPDIILQHCKQHLETYKVPLYIEISDGLPMTNSGKINKSKLN